MPCHTCELNFFLKIFLIFMDDQFLFYEKTCIKLESKRFCFINLKKFKKHIFQIFSRFSIL
jgi:hypothetical protein